MKNFWKNLPKPFFCLAPMDDVTDVVFRSIVTQTAKPDVLFTEFVNVEGLNSSGKDALLPRLLYETNQRPIVAQLWGIDPKNYYQTAKMVKKLGFDGVDINMGCPDKKVLKIGACSALINNHQLAKEIINATLEGAEGLPVSVKTRIGVKTIQTDEWVNFLLGFNLAALTIHGRTVKEQSKVPAHWEEIKRTVDIRNNLGVETLIIGNGDVLDREEGLTHSKETGVDGIMIGRGIFKDLWVFSEDSQTGKSEDEMLRLLLSHTRKFNEVWNKRKNFLILRKFFKIYTLGLEDASALRGKLMETKNIEQVEEIIREYVTH